jgi:Domain of unknown function (DUF1902)
MNANTIIVRAEWDEEASVWVATSEEIGLVTEAHSLELLRAKLPAMVQDLMDPALDGQVVPIEIIAHAHTQAVIGRSAA